MKIKHMAVVWISVYLMSVILSLGITVNDDSVRLSESELGVLCVQAVYPTITRGTERDMSGAVLADDKNVNAANESINNAETADIADSLEKAAQTVKSDMIIDTQNPDAPNPATVNTKGNKPLVIIYHTHATEAYQPVSGGNFRTVEEEGSVRDVGNVLTEELERLGIGVIHDKTLHDAESYNQSYTRSLATAKRLLAENPSAVFVIDLHRDAAAYTGNVGKTVEIDGETAATFSLVVGQGNENANSLNIFANAVLAKAEEMYPGFTNRLIEKEYKYNQYISDYCLLLEVGNNENNIKETRVTAKYFARVLKAVIDDIS